MFFHLLLILISGKCAGTLISKRVLVSAFHCTVDSKESKFKPCDHGDGQRWAIFGSNKINLTTPHKHHIIPIITVVHPPNQGLTVDDESHDFALLILAWDVRFSEKIQPICLPTQGEEFGGEIAFAAGWGRYSAFSESQANTLQKVKLTVSKKKFAHHKMLGTDLEYTKDGTVKDACSGDSGKF